MKRYNKPGRPVTHPPVKCRETGDIYETYTDAGIAVKGNRHGVRKCAEGTQKHHHGYHFDYVKK